MSGVVHSIGKVFSKVWDFVRPIVEVVAVVAAIYFTAGLALSAFPATAGFAAALPGFAADGVAGAGIFSQAASAIGLGGGLEAGAAADAAAAGIGSDAALAAAAGDAGTMGGGAAGAGADAAATPVAGMGGGAAAGASTAAAPAAVAAPAVSGGGTAAVGMSLTDKLMLASVATNAISGFTAPTPADIQRAKNGWYGAFFGKDANGAGATQPDLYNGPQSEQPRTFGQPAATDASPLVPMANTTGMAPNAPTLNTGAGPNVAAASPNMGTLAAPTPSPPPPTPLVPGVQTTKPSA